MIDIQSTELILKVSGEVQASNIKEFETQALLYIDQINTELVTDQDFAEAKQVVKSCKIAEDRIGNALQQAVMSMETVAEVKAIAEKLQVKLKDTRIMLDKKIKTEEAARKNEIVNAGINKVSEHLELTQVQHAFSVDIVAIKDAIKNKRSLESMEDAVNVVVEDQITKINDLETLYLENLVTIQKAESEYPGLFPDKKRLAVSSVEVVDAQISSRVNKYLFDMQQKKEAERLAREKAELKAKEEAKLKINENTEINAKKEERIEKVADEIQPEPIDVVPSFLTQGEEVREVTVIVRISATDTDRIRQEIKAINGVYFVSSGA